MVLFVVLVLVCLLIASIVLFVSAREERALKLRKLNDLEREQRFAGFTQSLHDQTPGHQILEVAFARDGQAREWSEYAAEAVQEKRPEALIVNFLELPEHVFGDEIGHLVRALYETRTDGEMRIRPCAVVASERKAESLRKLLELTRLSTFLDVAFFRNIAPAVEHLQARLREASETRG